MYCSHKSVPSINLEMPKLKFTSSRTVGCKNGRTRSNQALRADHCAWMSPLWFPNQMLCPCSPFLRQPHLHRKPSSISMRPRWSANPPRCSLLTLFQEISHLNFSHAVLAHLHLPLLTFFCPCSPSSVLAHLLLSLLTFFCPCSPSSVLAHLLLSLLTFFCPCSPSSVLAHLLSLLTFFCPCSPSSVLAHLLLSLLTFFCPWSPPVLNHLSLLTFSNFTNCLASLLTFPSASPNPPHPLCQFHKSDAASQKCFQTTPTRWQNGRRMKECQEDYRRQEE